MAFLKFLSLFLLVSQAYSEDLNEVQKAFIENDVVPTVIDSPPSKLLEVIYSESAVAQLGNRLSVFSVLSQPTFKWDADPNNYYTLLMDGYPVEPERNPQLLQNVKHMLLINIKGNDVSTAETLVSYLMPIPPPLLGAQRYTLLEYRQPGYLNLSSSFLEKKLDRFYFNVAEFANENSLVLESGNFFIAQIL